MTKSDLGVVSSSDVSYGVGYVVHVAGGRAWDSSSGSDFYDRDSRISVCLE